MLLTEEEARTKRCQEGFGPPLSANGTPMMTAATAVYTAIQTSPQNCIASGCMAWRWAEPPIEIDNGTSVDDLIISTRLLNCLKNEGVETVGEARSLPDAQLADMPNMGKTTLAEFKRVFGNSQHIAGTGYCGKAGKP